MIRPNEEDRAHEPTVAKGVDATEEAELQRLEHRLVHGDADGEAGAVELAGGGAVNVQAEEADASISTDAGAGVVVQGAAQRREQLESKKFGNGGFRGASLINALLPRGGAGLKTKVPKRTEFGAEGPEGDSAHASAMKQFSISEFGSSHVQDRTIDDRMCEVGLFGFWLEKNNYGKYVEWHLTEGAWRGIEPTACGAPYSQLSHEIGTCVAGARGKERCMVAVELDGTPRVPLEAAMMEYVLAMATGDVESRPKGGWEELKVKDGAWLPRGRRRRRMLNLITTRSPAYHTGHTP